MIGSPTRAKEAQRGAARFLHGRVAFAHQCAHRRRRGVEDVDLVLVDHFPEARARRIVRNAFEHQRRRAVRERPIDDVAVTRHPADVGRAPEDVAIVIIEHIFVGEGGVQRVAGGGVQHALRLSGRSRRVEDEQRIFGVHFNGRAVGGNLRRFLVIVEVAALVLQFRSAGSLHDDHGLDVRAARQRQIGIHLERNRLAAAQALVGGQNDRAFAIENAARQTVRREAGENHRMHRADARAGKHRIGGFRDHRQIDGDAVAFLDAVSLEHVGEAADLAMQFFIGDVAAVLRIVAFPDDGRLFGAFGQMPVDAVRRDVQRAVLEPFDEQVVRIPGHVLHLRERLDPVDRARPARARSRPDPSATARTSPRIWSRSISARSRQSLETGMSVSDMATPRPST